MGNNVKYQKCVRCKRVLSESNFLFDSDTCFECTFGEGSGIMVKPKGPKPIDQREVVLV